jgi:hypothetical protein
MNQRSEDAVEKDRNGNAAEATRVSGEQFLARAMISLALALLVLASALAMVIPSPRLYWNLGFVKTQDLPVAILYVVALAGTVFTVRCRWTTLLVPRSSPALVVIAALSVLAATGGCAVWLMDGFAFSHDEHTLVQEAKVFASGRLATPLPPEWRPLVHALHPFFVRVNEDFSLLSTGYFPGSAALYAAFELAGAGPLLNPVLAAGSVLLTAHIARRIFPGAPEAAVLAAVLLAVSPQFLVTAMTPFAMTAHLFLNLTWLALFLRDTRLGHVAAMVIGVVAIWQHQIHIHPLFALPFLADLAFRRRKWGLVLAYGAIYAGALTGCMFWHRFVLGGPAVHPAIQRIEVNGFDYLFKRIVNTIVAVRSPSELIYWPANLLRLAVWQNPATLILAVVGLLTIRRAPRTVRLLAIGLPLALLPNVLLVYDQGVGWGFRYLHVHLGTLSLLSVWAVIELRRRAQDVEEWPRVAAGLLVLGILSAPVLVGWRIMDFTSVVFPYQAAEARFREMDADILLTSHAGLIRNDFAFGNSPKILLLNKQTEEQIAMLCARWKVAMVPPDLLTSLGIGDTAPELEPDHAKSHYARVLARLDAAGCR